MKPFDQEIQRIRRELRDINGEASRRLKKAGVID
jgi:hypothetical protein